MAKSATFVDIGDLSALLKKKAKDENSITVKILRSRFVMFCAFSPFKNVLDAVNKISIKKASIEYKKITTS